MKISDAYPSKFLKASDLDGQPHTVTFRSVVRETVGMFSDGPQPVAYFNEFGKAMVLNKTNGKAVAKLFGDETSAWIGKKIVLYEAMVEFQGETVNALRIRPARPSAEPVPWEDADTAPSIRPRPIMEIEKTNLPQPSIITEGEAVAKGGIKAFRSWRDGLNPEEYLIVRPETERLTLIAQQHTRPEDTTSTSPPPKLSKEALKTVAKEK